MFWTFSSIFEEDFDLVHVLNFQLRPDKASGDGFLINTKRKGEHEAYNDSQIHFTFLSSFLEQNSRLLPWFSEENNWILETNYIQKKPC